MTVTPVHDNAPIPRDIFVPYDPAVNWYDTEAWLGGNRATAWEHSGWRDETMAWKTSVTLNGTLNPTNTYVLRGPDVLEFMSAVSVNSYKRFDIGTSKHAIMVNEDGFVIQHGMILRTAEEEFYTFWLTPMLRTLLEESAGKYDIQGETLTGRRFLFQLSGPRSLETLEAATGEDLHDIRFLRHRESAIAGHTVRVLRVGMSGGLGYEVHGDTSASFDVYRALLEAGRGYGLRQLGVRSYMCNHTEGGFAQMRYHFPTPWGNDSVFRSTLGVEGAYGNDGGFNLRGSAGTDITKRFRNPFELGWGHMVNFEHDFIGKAALQAVANSSRTMVTLVWNAEDITDVYSSQLRAGEEYLPMEFPNHYRFESGDVDHRVTLWADDVLDGDTIVGQSSGRTYTNYSREVISLCSIDAEYAGLGTEVIVNWGNPGTPQKRIRAIVSRFPYLDVPRNEKFDVSTIPSGVAGARPPVDEATAVSTK